MSAQACAKPIPPLTLEAYWLGELAEAEAAPVEEHLMACGACAAELALLVELAASIRRLARDGRLPVVLSPAAPGRLAGSGLHVREYSVAPNRGVLCTVAPDDNIVVARLQARLAGVRRLDLQIQGLAGPGSIRMADIPFDERATEVVMAPPMDALRALAATTVRISLIAVDAGAERVVGEYAFHHTPWPGAAGGPNESA